jgi:hypothetical protein
MTIRAYPANKILVVYNGTLLIEIERIKEDIAILKREE